MHGDFFVPRKAVPVGLQEQSTVSVQKPSTNLLVPEGHGEVVVAPELCTTVQRLQSWQELFTPGAIQAIERFHVDDTADWQELLSNSPVIGHGTPSGRRRQS